MKQTTKLFNHGFLPILLQNNFSYYAEATDNQLLLWAESSMPGGTSNVK